MKKSWDLNNSTAQQTLKPGFVEKSPPPSISKHNLPVVENPENKANQGSITVGTKNSNQGKYVERQPKISINWLRTSLVLGNLSVLFAATATFAAWYELRQEHLSALTNTIENEGVVMQVLDGGWCLEVGLLVTGMGLLSHYLIGGIVMPLRLGRSTGFLLGAYLVFTSAAMLWQVCAALAICHILPSPPSGTALGSDRFLLKWGVWLASSLVACLPVQIMSAAIHLAFDKNKELELERVQLRKHTVEGEGGAIRKQEEAEQSRLSSKELAYYVTEMPAEQLKRKSQEPLSPFSRIRSESKTSTLPPTFHSVYLDSSKRFDDYSFYYDEYLDMEDCLEDIEQGDGEKFFCSGNTPPPSYTLAVNV